MNNTVYVIRRGHEVVCAIADKNKAQQYVMTHGQDKPGLKMWMEKIELM